MQFVVVLVYIACLLAVVSFLFRENESRFHVMAYFLVEPVRVAVVDNS